MKFTISTFFALAIAVPMSVVQAAQFTIAVENTLDAGLIKVFPAGDYVKLRKGVDPQPIGDLTFTSAFQDQRFDIIDNREGGAHQRQYYKCKVSLSQVPSLKQEQEVKILVDGKLDDPKCVLVGEKEVTDKVTMICEWWDNST